MVLSYYDQMLLSVATIVLLIAAYGMMWLGVAMLLRPMIEHSGFFSFLWAGLVFGFTVLAGIESQLIEIESLFDLVRFILPVAIFVAVSGTVAGLICR